MELLLQAIEKKLSHVDGERKRWQEYKEEHEQAGNNLREFQKSFRREILVPIGSKALMPGHLYHMNEIFVGMYCGLFVKCSADKALSVCQHRLGEANKRIDALNVEHKMYKDRLGLPNEMGMFGDVGAGESREIIEEYNEEAEKEWREQHKIRMRNHKQAEAKERKRMFDGEADGIDIDEILRRAEEMEEMENDLEYLNINDDADLQKHLQVLQPADDENAQNSEFDSTEFSSLRASAAGLSIEDKINFYEIHLQKIREYFTNNPRTLHNFDEYTDKRVTEENLQNAIEELQETFNNYYTTKTEQKQSADKMVDNQNECRDSMSVTPNEPRKFHNRTDFDAIEREYAQQNKSKSELLVFYKSQLRNVMKLIAGCTIDLHSKEEKRDLYEFLSDRIASLRDEIQKENQIKLEEEFVDDDDIDKNVKPLGRSFQPNCNPFELDDFKEDENTTEKRKISFASQPITVTFFEDDEPCIVSQENMTNLMDSTFQFFNSPSSSSASSVCGDDEDNEQHRPMNSTNDCDMNFPLNQSNESTINTDVCSNEMMANSTPRPTKPTTLIVQFNHSSNECTSTISNDDEIINSPLDIYRQFGANTEPTNRVAFSPPPPPDPNQSNSVSKLNNENNPTKSRPLNDTGCGDGAQLLGINLMEVPNINQKPSKSILKNSALVKHEPRASDSLFDDIDDPMDANEPFEFPQFTQVLGDIVEHNNNPTINDNVNNSSSQSNNNQTIYTQSSDANNSTNSQPKKRISLFKQSRM